MWRAIGRNVTGLQGAVTCNYCRWLDEVEVRSSPSNGRSCLIAIRTETRAIHT